MFALLSSTLLVFNGLVTAKRAYHLHFNETDVSDCVENGVYRSGGIKVDAANMARCHDLCLHNYWPKNETKQCKGWAWKQGISPMRRKPCRLFSNVRRLKSAEGWLAGKLNCHPYDGKVKVEEARDHEKFRAGLFAAADLTSSRPLIGFSAYQWAGGAGNLAYHMGIFYISDLSKYQPAQSDRAEDEHFTCSDVGTNKLQFGLNLDSLDLTGANIEVTIDNGYSSSDAANVRYPAMFVNSPGKHPAGEFFGTPHNMQYLEVDISMDEFLDTVKATGSMLLEMGGYDMSHGKDCQLFTIVALMRLGLPTLVKEAMHYRNHLETWGGRADFGPKFDDSDVKICDKIGNPGNLAGWKNNPHHFDWCAGECVGPWDASVFVSGSGFKYVDIKWCLPTPKYKEECAHFEATTCGLDGLPACLMERDGSWVDGITYCDNGHAAYGFCQRTDASPHKLCIDHESDLIPRKC